MGRKELKEKAKASLTGNYGESIKVLLIYYGLIFGISLIISLLVKANLFDKGMANILDNILSFIIAPLLSMGMVSFYLKIARNEKVTYNELFSKTNYFWKNLGYTILVLIVYFIFMAIFFSSTFLLTAINFHYQSIMPLAVILSIMMVCLMLFIEILLSCIYAEWSFIALDNEKLHLIETMKKSRIMMRGHKWELFKLLLSFIGWYILSIFTLGILLLWIIPYQNVTFANFYDSIKNDKNDK